jgi:hypothetical protein
MHTGVNKELKKRLDEMDEIPEGIQFDPDTAWERIENRMGSQRSRKKQRLFIYSAAAALLIAFVIYVVNLNKERPMGEGIAQGQLKINLPIKTTLRLEPERSKSPDLERSGLTLHPPGVTVIRPEKTIIEEQTPVIVSNQDDKQSEIIPPVESATVQPLQQKHRFPIAHSNELRSLPAGTNLPETLKIKGITAIMNKEKQLITVEQAIDPDPIKKPRTLMSRLTTFQ